MKSLSPFATKLITSPHGSPCSAITAVKSLRCVASSTAGSAGAENASITKSKARHATRFLTAISSGRSRTYELFAIGEDSPDRFARGIDRVREGGIAVLQHREHFHQQQFVGAAQVGERRLQLPLVVGAELREQVVDLVLQRQLGHEPDRLRRLQLLLEHLEIERRGTCRLRGGRLDGARRRGGRWSRR